MKVFVFPFFLLQLALTAGPSVAWLSALSFKGWRLLCSIIILVLALIASFTTRDTSSLPFIAMLSPEMKLSRVLKPYNDTYFSFSGTQPSFEEWQLLQAEYPTHRDVLVQTALSAYYAGEYQEAEMLWQKAKKSDPLYPVFKDVPSLLPLTSR